MSDAVATLAQVKREFSPTLRPRDAATLIVLDRSAGAPKVLMGRRHTAHKFMPGKFVFPGGRVEPYDGRMAVVNGLPPAEEARLLKHVQRPLPSRARAFALAAIRETAEETGLLLGRKSAEPPKVPSDSWRSFAEANVFPDLAGLHFIARAITPPGRSRRFDARFFVADAELIAHRIEGVAGADAELDELVWIPVGEAKRLDLPTITQIVVEELERRIAAGFDSAAPVPFYRTLHRRVVREML
ncbi:MAG TPA: NUDIX hydrolase [Xanthobacteraceae bacterium]|nr:NUDIX hydrolase [Xanthobacteraceae bacterium]